MKKRAGENSPPELASEETLQELNLRMREKGPNGHRIESFEDLDMMENLHLTNAYYDKSLPGEPAGRMWFGQLEDPAQPILPRRYADTRVLARALQGWESWAKQLRLPEEG